MTGAGRRTKGHSFERLIAQAFRKRWPDKVIRRALQSHQAFEPDVVVEGLPLWCECQHANTPYPLAKLAQAERDADRCTEPMHPVVVWRKTGERTVWVTMRLGTLCRTYGLTERMSRIAFVGSEAAESVVTVDFAEWLALVDLESA